MADPKKRIKAWEEGRENYEEYTEPEVTIIDPKKKKGILSKVGEDIKDRWRVAREIRREEVESYRKALREKGMIAAKKRGEKRAKARIKQVYEPKQITGIQKEKSYAHPFGVRLFAKDLEDHRSEEIYSPPAPVINFDMMGGFSGGTNKRTKSNKPLFDLNLGGVGGLGLGFGKRSRKKRKKRR